MTGIREVQERAWANKLAKGFNTDDVALEYCYLIKEVAEAIDAWQAGDAPALADELADVVIFVGGLAQMAGVDLEQAVAVKLVVIEKRQYRRDPQTGRMIKEESR